MEKVEYRKHYLGACWRSDRVAYELNLYLKREELEWLSESAAKGKGRVRIVLKENKWKALKGKRTMSHSVYVVMKPGDYGYGEGLVGEDPNGVPSCELPAGGVEEGGNVVEVAKEKDNFAGIDVEHRKFVKTCGRSGAVMVSGWKKGVGGG